MYNQYTYTNTILDYTVEVTVCLAINTIEKIAFPLNLAYSKDHTFYSFVGMLDIFSCFLFHVEEPMHIGGLVKSII